MRDWPGIIELSGTNEAQLNLELKSHIIVSMLRERVESLNRIEDKLMWLVAPLGVVIGLLLGDSISSAAYLGKYIFMILTFSGAISMQAREFLNVLKHPKAIITFLVAGKIVSPLICTLLIKLIMPDMPESVLGYILVLTGPIAVTSFIWSGIYKGNGSLALTLIMLDTIITPFSMPLYTSLLSGQHVEIDVLSMMLSLVELVVLPMAVGIGANELSGNKLKTKYSIYFKPIGKLALFVALVLNCCKVRDAVTSLTWSDWTIVVSAFIVVIVSFFIGYLACRMLKIEQDRTVTVTFCCGLKNNTASLVIATSFFSSEAALSVVMLILFQQVICSWLGTWIFQSRKKQPQIDSNQPDGNIR